MKLYTLWQRDPSNPDDDPWCVGAIDEMSILENDGYPDDYAKARELPDVRELVLVIPHAALALWTPPSVKVTVDKDDAP